MGEINLYGIYIPTLLVQAVIAYVLFKILSPFVDRFAQMEWIGLPSIFNLCFYLALMLCVHEIFVRLWI
ncbi:DUF1656 domain-containing protein [Acinetobacter junii]|uniref:DUF1656 domain-containing protein n=1 Tax=Acinetobacter junii TaxID=40215 RepID=UPI003AA86A20